MNKSMLVVVVMVFGISIGIFDSDDSPDHYYDDEPVKTLIDNPQIHDSDKDWKDLPDSKGTPCNCTHDETKESLSCEHEKLWCDDDAADFCENQIGFSDYTCQRVSPPTNY